MSNWIKNKQDLKNLKTMLERHIDEKQDEIDYFNFEGLDEDDYYEALDDLSNDVNDLKVLVKFRTDIEGVDDLKVVNGLIKKLTNDPRPSTQWWYNQIKQEFNDKELKHKNNQFNR